MTVLPPFLVPQTHTIRQAMEQLEKTEEKIVFVVDAESRLIGSLTDGDIRRWILSDGDSEGAGARVCNCNPYVVEEGFEIEQVRARHAERQPRLRSGGQSVSGNCSAVVLEGAVSRRSSNQTEAPPESAGRYYGRGAGDPARALHQCSSQATHPCR